MAEEKIKTTADRIVELGAELEAPGHAALEDASVVKARAVLHQWIDEMKGIVDQSISLVFELLRSSGLLRKFPFQS